MWVVVWGEVVLVVVSVRERPMKRAPSWSAGVKITLFICLLALIGVGKIDASAAVKTLDILTFIDVDLAMDALVSRLASALVMIDSIQTVGAVLAWVRRAFVDVCTGEHLLINKDSECHQN